MIEKTVQVFLNRELSIPVWMEKPEEDVPEEYVLIEKTGSSPGEHIRTSTLAVQSYAATLEHAAQLNETIKPIMRRLIELDAVTKVVLDSDYNFTDREKKKYRYQAVYDLTHYE